jgi:3-isopropylmalate dehydrogenase
MSAYRVMLLPGDGIGPEIVEAAKQVLAAVGPRFDFTIEYEQGLLGGCAIDALGTPMEDGLIERCRSCDAVLLGAVGGPKWDTTDPHKPRPEQGLLGMRQGLELFANLRPVTSFPALAHNSTLQPDVGLAEGRRGLVHSVDKANVLESSRLWRAVAIAVAERHQDVELRHMLVDNCAMQLIRDPKQFDVIATENLFGDVLSDEAAMLTGSIGMLPSASVGAGGVSLYEPIHGSAPDIVGRGLANPCATVLSAAMMLELSFGEVEAARAVEGAVETVLQDGARTADLAAPGESVLGTTEMTDRILTVLAAD